MTPAEQALLDAALTASSYDEPVMLAEARRAVLLERLPEGYERTLHDLAFRAFEASETAHTYRMKHPLGDEFYAKAREEWQTLQRAKEGPR